MLVVFGYRFFGGKPVAFRNDYCLTCGTPRLSYQIRAFLCLQLFWLPVVPLGFYKTWRCESCGQRPHRGTKTSSRFMRWLVVLFIAVVGAVMWDSPIEEQSAVLMWGMRVAMPLALVPAIWLALRTPAEPQLAALLPAIPRSVATQCPRCSGKIAGYTPYACAGCGIERRNL